MKNQQGMWKTGHVESVDRRKRFALIRPQGEEIHIFGHFSDITSNDEWLSEGDAVRFIQVRDAKGWRAQEIHRLRG